jgi:PadR family transcriptional regulator PadR
MRDDTAELLRGTLATLVLSLLKSGPLYGYDIAKRIRTLTGGVLHLKEGSLYPALHAMERDGLLAAEWLAVERGPSRKYYRLTRKGKAALAKRRSHWRQFRDAVDRVVALHPAEIAT